MIRFSLTSLLSQCGQSGPLDHIMDSNHNRTVSSTGNKSLRSMRDMPFRAYLQGDAIMSSPIKRNHCQAYAKKSVETREVKRIIAQKTNVV